MNKPKIFVLLSRIPFPLEKGDKLRAYNQLKVLSEKFSISLFALTEEKIHIDAQKELLSFCDEFNYVKINPLRKYFSIFKAFFTKLPFQVAYYYSPKIKKEIDRTLKSSKADLAYVQLVRMSKYVENIDIIKLIDFQDALSVNMSRRAEKETFLKKMFFNIESRRMEKYEDKINEIFDASSIISHNDKDLMKLQNPQKLSIVPNGVDFDFYQKKEIEKRFSVVFIGNMGYAPNIDASKFLVEEIMPFVWAKLPNANVALAGASPANSVKNLASEKVLITGWVDDIREYYLSSEVFVAPLRMGSGMQNKLLEAIALQVPCVSTSLAADPIGLVDKNTF
jgi:glycosyltransferase involved in cell wall biosynthesis